MKNMGFYMFGHMNHLLHAISPEVLITCDKQVKLRICFREIAIFLNVVIMNYPFWKIQNNFSGNWHNFWSPNTSMTKMLSQPWSEHKKQSGVVGRIIICCRNYGELALNALRKKSRKTTIWKESDHVQYQIQSDVICFK